MAFEIENGEPNPTHLAAETLGHGILDALVHQLDRFKKPFRQLDEFEQNKAIDELRVVTQTLVMDAMGVLFRGTYPACVASLGAVTFGDKIKAVLTINKDAKHRHDLSDAIGRGMVLVIADPDQYLLRMEEIRGAAAQGELVLHRAATPPDSAPKAAVLGFPGASVGERTDAANEPLDHAARADAKREAEVSEVLQALDGLGFDHTAEEIDQWKPKQRKIALDYAKRATEYPMTTQPLPHFMRTPKVDAAPENFEEN